jgi:Tfp pilus assembly protein PilO
MEGGKAMREKLARLPHELGALGLASLLLLAALAVFHFAALKPLEARSALLKERVSRQAPRAEPGQPGSTADKVSAVYDFLRKDEQATDWLAKLHGIGTATGVQLKSASYRTQPTEGRIVRYEIVLPVAGSYPQLREFLKRSLAEIPVLSIDQLTLKRESRKDGALQAELRMTLHMVKS